MNEYRWLNQYSKSFLEKDYLLPNQTVDERVDIIFNHAEDILGISGFAKQIKTNFQKGWYSLSTPIWTNFGTNRGLPISCFNSHIEDSLQSILGTLAEVGIMTKHGGGTSGYFGELRGRGSEIKNNGTSDGAVHFMGLYDNLLSVVSQGSCYVEGTEVLTDKGFKDFRKVTPDDSLAQLDAYNNISFTQEYELVVNDFKGDVICFKGKKKNNSVVLKVTPNHRMVVSRLKMKNRQEYWPDETDIVEAKDLKLHRDNRLHLAGWAGNGGGITDHDRLRIAFQADGKKDGVNRKIRFHFTKERKINRLIKILSNLSIEYNISQNPDGSTNVVIEYDETVKKDTFEWINLREINGTWASEFIEELALWDGNKKESGLVTYSSIIKENVDIVQAVAALANKKTRLRIRPSSYNRFTLYNISISNNPYRAGDGVENYNEYYNGKVYCAIVPEGRLLVRYEGRVLVCGNTRRGNFAAYLPVDHPDINEFLTIKSEGSPLQDISFGVVIPDGWMESMIKGSARKRKIWAKILERRAEVGFPYIIFADNVNKNKPQVYHDHNMKINASNLCVSGDQLVVTDRGMKRAVDLYNEGSKLNLFDGEKRVSASPMRLIEKNADVYEITTKSGRTHKITSYHKVKTKNGMVALSDLKIGDKIVVQRNRGLFGKIHDRELSFLFGLYQGDGTQTDKEVFIDIWEGKTLHLKDEVEASLNKVYAENKLVVGSNNRIYDVPKFGFSSQRGIKKGRLGSQKLAQFGFEKGNIPQWLWDSDEETQAQFLRGLYLADGTISSMSKSSSLSLSLASIDKAFLRKIQIMLSNMGIKSSIYSTKDCWRLVITNKKDILQFNRLTGFVDEKNIFIEDREYRDNTKKFEEISSIEYIGKEDVYCTTVDSAEHVWVCNSFITSNCSEITLPSTETESFVCDLSSMNILYYDEWKDTNAVELLVFFLDAVMSDFTQKAYKIKFMERAVLFAERHRALGVGWLGWHSYLQSRMIPLESMQAKLLNAEIAQNIQRSAYNASEKLFDLYGASNLMAPYKRRNSTLTAIAPTKSSSFILGQVSEGIEPIRTNYYIKDLAKGKFTLKNIYLEHFLELKGKNDAATWKKIKMHNGSVQTLDFMSQEEKDVFRTFAEISQMEIIIQASQRQKYIDQSQSLNLMIHPSVSAKDINKLIISAWELGVKTLYYQISVNAAQEFTRPILECTSCEA